MFLFYDFEVFKYDWMVVCIDPTNNKEYVIVNDELKLKSIYYRYKNAIWVGYNSRHYDQWILKAILCGFNPKEINDWLIIKGRRGSEFSKVLYQVPLNNYDCMTSFHSLKQLEAFMGKSIVETSVPFDIDRKLTPAEIEETIKYCRYDVQSTIDVFLSRKEEFDSHFGLIKMFNLPLSDISKTKVQLSAKILSAKKIKRNDEFDIKIADTIRIEKYKECLDWFQNNWNYDKGDLFVKICDVWHILGAGGIHGAKGTAIKKNTKGEWIIDKKNSNAIVEFGQLLHIDVSSYYPSLMIEYQDICASRNIPNKDKFRQIRDTRLKYKAEKNPLQAPLKIVINGTYGAMKDKYNPLYDPRQANNVCINGMLMLVDLLEKLEGHCELIQSNTDGIIVKLHDNYDEVVAICEEWSKRVRMVLEYDKASKIIQGDVNNYVCLCDGWVESKGGYVKSLNDLDYDLPIVNKAINEYLINGVPVESTIMNCNDLRDYQKIVKVSSKYKFAVHNNNQMSEKCFRVFASLDFNDTYIGKCKDVGLTVEKFANTPEHCFIVNCDVRNTKASNYPKLDKQWYINLTKKRIREKFGIFA